MGSVGKALDPTSNKFLGLNNVPVVGNLASRVAGDVATGGGAEFGRRDPFYGLVTNRTSGLGSIYDGLSPDSPPPIPGPFSLDPAQRDADIGAIQSEGQKQYQQAQDFIGSDAASRAAARAQLADVLTKQAQDTFARTLPDIAENAQAHHLYDSSGYGQEVARQQGYLAEDIANKLGLYGINDIANISAQKQAALQGLQGFQTGGLQRGLSLEDFINQANVAKTIGAQMAPQPPTGKAQAGSVLQGIGAVTPAAKLALGK